MVFDLFTPSRPQADQVRARASARTSTGASRAAASTAAAASAWTSWTSTTSTPLARGGSNDRRNLHLLCRTCNLRKGTKTDREFRQAYRNAGVPQTHGAPKRDHPPIVPRCRR